MSGLAACRTCNEHGLFKSKIRRENGRPISQAAKSALRAGENPSSAGFLSAQRCFSNLSSGPLHLPQRFSRFKRTLKPKSDRLLAKLKADAGIVLADLWRALRHQPAVEDREWLHPRVTLPAKEAPRGEPVQGGPRQSGLCYFHLN